MYKKHYNHHPAPRPARRPAPRVQLNILRLDEDGNSIYDDDLEEHVCTCYPTTSSRFVPSMLYDNLKCPHRHTKHVFQPAQQQVFAYPWTANTKYRESRQGESTSTRNALSAIQEESAILPSREEEPEAIRTAPPFANVYQQQTFRPKPPFTAPIDSEWPVHVQSFKKSNSVPSLTGFRSPRSNAPKSRESRGVQSQGTWSYRASQNVPIYRTEGNYLTDDDLQDDVIEPTTPYVSYDRRMTKDRVPTGRPPRNFEGTYVDPKNNQVYKFKVNYGKKSVQAERTPDATFNRSTPDVRR